ncbi:unnamed protein product [Caenorhabditis brenneri]
MKLVLAITCLVFSALGVSSHEIRAKRGFSEDAIKKMTDALNKDREEILKKANFPFTPTSSRSDYEKKADMLDCSQDRSEELGIPLQLNDVAEELLKKLNNRSSLSVEFFHYAANVFGCSSTYKCRKTVKKEQARTKDTEHLIGKTIMINGMCITNIGSLSDAKFESQMKTMNLPHPSKYGDLLGVPKVNGAGLNSFFFLIPLFLVLYI